jgi:hypothetical protein
VIDVTRRIDAIRTLNILPDEEIKALTIKDAKAGSFLEFGNETFKVMSISYYLEVKWKNFKRKKQDYLITELELFSLEKGESSYLEWEVDDELEISHTRIMPKMRELTFDGRKLTTQLLEDIAEEEEGQVSYKGDVFDYSEDDTWAGLFSRSKDFDQGIPVRAYEFESEKGACLTVETWHEESDERPDREAFISSPINPRALRVIQVL